jgi:hypothetical protein
MIIHSRAPFRDHLLRLEPKMRFTSACILVALTLGTVPLLCAEEITVKVTAYEMNIDNEMYEKVSEGGGPLLFGRELEEKYGKEAWSISETQAIEVGKEFEIRGERTKTGQITVSGLVQSLGDGGYAANLKLRAELISPNGRSVTTSDSDAFFSKDNPSYFNGLTKGKRDNDGGIFDARVRLVKIEVVE